jgi:AraC family L-rhamnose operon regulatory protein RhaS
MVLGLAAGAWVSGSLRVNSRNHGRVLLDPAATDIEHGMQRAFPPPIYRSGSDRFEIDDCEAQSKAAREGKIEFHALTKGHYPGRRMESNELPGLTNVGFWNCRGAQDWGLAPHRNEGLEIVFLETGGMGFEVDGRTHGLHAGNLTVTRPWQLHRLGDPHIGRGRLNWVILDVGVRRPNQEWRWPSWVVLSPGDRAELTRKLRHGEQAVWTAGPRMRQVFGELADCVLRWGGRGAGSRLAVAVNRLLVELLDVLAEERVDESAELVSRRRTVELFLRDLADNPASAAESWTLEAMAAHCGMGVTSLAKYGRELVNCGPMAYLGSCRLAHAARALRDEATVSVTEVAMRAGFNSSQYFATAFQREFGRTPSAYRAASLRERAG